MKLVTRWLLLSCVCVFSMAQAGTANASEKSVHIGFLHPSGADLFGYSVERHMNDKLYWYYTIGVPSVLAIGIINCHLEQRRDLVLNIRRSKMS